MPPPATVPSMRPSSCWRFARLKLRITVGCLVAILLVSQLQVITFLRAAGYRWTVLSKGEEQCQQQQETPLDQLPLAGNTTKSPPLISSTMKKPRLFDVVLLNSELHWLEIRMNELESVVDTFVIIESEQTFQQHRKPLYFQQALRQPRFARFMDRVLHIVVPNITQTEFERNIHIGGHGPWAVESYLRSKGMQMALETFRPSPGDWVLHSDLDEIPRASTLAKIKLDPNSVVSEHMKMEDKPISQLRLSCNLFYYSYEYKRPVGHVGPNLARFELAPDDVDPTIDDDITFDKDGRRVFTKPLWEDWSNAGIRLRRLGGDLSVPMVENACWHCSWCFSNITQVFNKAASYSHTEHNTLEYMNEKWIVEHFRQGKDLFERDGEVYVYEPPTDIPQYVAEQSARFLYLTHRYQVKNAGFIDVPEHNINY
ncbi:hypothetical protein BGW41_007102 [Actinomortierella wolfii]|nr:hypothetical protein BGW41_007102 [Actinomortierella wolfii]